jgi:hypothetical protein
LLTAKAGAPNTPKRPTARIMEAVFLIMAIGYRLS